MEPLHRKQQEFNVIDEGWNSIKFKIPYNYEAYRQQYRQKKLAVYFKEIFIHFLAALQHASYWTAF
jgi:hypothetical protein